MKRIHFQCHHAEPLNSTEFSCCPGSLLPIRQAHFSFESSFDRFTVPSATAFSKGIPDSKLPPSHTGAAFGVQGLSRSNPLLRSGHLPSFSEVQTILVFPPSVFCYTHQFASAETSSTNTTTHVTLARTSDAGIAQLGNL